MGERSWEHHPEKRDPRGLGPSSGTKGLVPDGGSWGIFGTEGREQGMEVEREALGWRFMASTLPTTTPAFTSILVLFAFGGEASGPRDNLDGARHRKTDYRE